MKPFVILPDVTCDLSPEMRQYFGLNDYIRGHAYIDEREIVTALDWENVSHEEYYGALANKKVKVSSAAASPEEYYQAFKKYAQDGYDIISMSISSTISGTYSVAALSAQRIKQDYPDCNIVCIDTKRMSGSFGLLVAYACQMQKDGATFDQVVSWIEENKCRVHQMGPIDDLTVIARRGRISKGKAFFGNLAGVKPMGDSNQEGYVTVLAKAKGIKKALDATVTYVKNMATDIENQYIIILHSDRKEYAVTLQEKLQKEITCKKIFLGDIYSACATNIGAGMICVYFMGEPISADGETEKRVLQLAVE